MASRLTRKILLIGLNLLIFNIYVATIPLNDRIVYLLAKYLLILTLIPNLIVYLAGLYLLLPIAKEFLSIHAINGKFIQLMYIYIYITTLIKVAGELT